MSDDVSKPESADPESSGPDSSAPESADDVRATADEAAAAESPAEDSATSDESDSAATKSGRRGVATLALAGVALLLVGLGLGVGLGTWLSSNVTDDDVPAANSAAVGFAQDMIRHHEQGVQMAAWAMNNGVDPQVKSLAYDILTTQSNEIGQMQSWLTRWGYPIINPGEPMDWMGHDHDMGSMGSGSMHSGMPGMSMAPSSTVAGGHDHGSMPMPMPMPTSGMPTAAPAPSGAPAPAPTTAPAPSTAAAPTTDASADEPPMPGMATDAEMAKLRSLKGRDSDVYFMQLMLRHHQGGEHMMEYAADPQNVSQDYVRDLASTMLRTQGNEIKTLQAMLASYGAPELPMN